MRIPQAKENIQAHAPQVRDNGISVPRPVDTGIADAGMALKQSLQTAADGFVKLYAADQRADAIKNFNDYNQAVQEYRDSAEIDPTTGQPVGFTQLIGDQVNEGSLQAAQNKVLEARKKLDASMRGYIPDIQNEFGMRADEVQANFDTATNAHFLKSKYEKAKNASDLDNENIKNNTYFDPNDVAKMEATYQSLYNNYYSYYQDAKASEKKAKEDMAKIIENNVNAIMQEGENISYDKARQYAGSPNIRKALGEEGYRALKHKIDLESAQWQMKLPDTTTESIQTYIKNHTDHLTPKEKALFVAEAQKNDASRAGGVGEKNESLWSEFVSRLGNAQSTYLSNPNELGISVNRAVSPEEAAEFRSRFLSFADMVVGGIDKTPYNQNEIEKRGLDALVDEETLKSLRKGKYGELMRIATNQIDGMVKKGQLPLLTSTQSGNIQTKIDRIKRGDPNIGRENDAFLSAANEFNKALDVLSSGKATSVDVSNAFSRLRQVQSFEGLASFGYNNGTQKALVQKGMEILKGKYVPAYEKEMGFFEKGFATIGGKIQSVRAAFDASWWNPWKVTLDPKDSANNKMLVTHNNEVLKKLDRISYTEGETSEGGVPMIPFLFKIPRDAANAMMNGEGVTLMNVREDGTPDTQTMQPRQRFAIENYAPNGIDVNTTEMTVFRTANQFMDMMNAKYNTKNFNDINKVDLNKLAPEDKRLLRDLMTRNWLEDNNIKGKTMLPITPVTYQQDVELPVYFGGVDDPFETPAFYQKSQYKKEDKDLYLASVDFTARDVKVKDFIGGVASNESLVGLLEKGYVDGEDYSVQMMLNNTDPNVSFSKSEFMHNMLSSLAPWGLRTKYLNPKDGKVASYYSIMNNIEGSAMAALEKDKSKQNARMEIKQEELDLLNEILAGLEKDNPGVTKDKFLQPLSLGYNVSQETLDNAIEKYQKLRQKRLKTKRETYMLLGGIAPSQATIDYVNKQYQENN